MDPAGLDGTPVAGDLVSGADPMASTDQRFAAELELGF
jgi:hypothetical protein